MTWPLPLKGAACVGNQPRKECMERPAVMYLIMWRHPNRVRPHQRHVTWPHGTVTKCDSHVAPAITVLSQRGNRSTSSLISRTFSWHLWAVQRLFSVLE